jgi:hypothetical protein
MTIAFRGVRVISFRLFSNNHLETGSFRFHHYFCSATAITTRTYYDGQPPPALAISEAKTNDDKKKPQQALSQAVEDSIRSYIGPWLHLRQRQNEAVERFHQSLGETTNVHAGATTKTSPIEILASLNGYTPVSGLQLNHEIALAEGVVSKPKYNRLRRDGGYSNYKLYSKGMEKETTSNKPSFHNKNKGGDPIPDFVEQNITIYRVLENGVNVVMTSLKDSLVQWFGSSVQRPLQSLASRFHTIINSDVKSSESSISESTTVPDGRIGQEDEVEPEEYLIVVNDDESSIRIMTHMKPSLRLLALPHDLGHNSASTLISVSLVVFGALPLARRSLQFATDYPGLSEMIAASVVGTISYGIWSTRSNARTNQSRVVANALAWRIYARDDAAILLLQEGAVSRLALDVLAVYNNAALQNKEISREGNVVEELFLINPDFLSPVEIALRLGIIETVHHGNDQKRIAIPLADALVNVTTKRQSLLSSLE